MPSPITGTDGGLRIKRPNGQSLYFTWIGKWTFKSERKTDDIGPHIGDATIYPVAGAKKGTYALEGTIPQDGDVAQDALFDAHEAGDKIELELYALRGRRILFTGTLNTSFEITLDTKGSHTLKADGYGPYAISKNVT